MIYQAQFAGTFNWIPFVGGMVISGVPGALQAVSLLAGRMPSALASSPEPPSQLESSTP